MENIHKLKHGVFLEFVNKPKVFELLQRAYLKTKQSPSSSYGDHSDKKFEAKLNHKSLPTRTVCYKK